MDQWKEGDRVTWHHIPGKGRPASQVPGIVLNVLPVRVRIRVLIPDGRESVVAVRSVLPATLTPRTKHEPRLDETL